MSDLHQEDAHGTHLQPEERAGLRLAYITLRRELNNAEQQNIVVADTWAFSRRHDPLRAEFGRGLHRRMFSNVWKWAGEFRTSNKNLGVNFPLIHARLYDVLDNTKFWIDHKTYPQDEIGVRFHHGLVVVHPFPNGNGRWSRLMADVLVTRLGGTRFTWGNSTLRGADKVRAAYIETLQAADDHDFGQLIAFARS